VKNKRITIAVILILVVIALIAELVIPLMRSQPSEIEKSATSGEATTVLPGEVGQAEIAQAKDSLGILKTALEAYRADTNSYPTSLNWTDGTPLTPTYLDPDDWNRILASVADIGGTISPDDYRITVHARDKDGTTIILTPRGFFP
jgi:type II secretory pathway pseudopilin PulG